MELTYFYPRLVPIIFQVIKDVFEDGRFADRGLEFQFKKNKDLKPREKEFVATTAYDLIRNWRFLQTLTQQTNASIYKNPSPILFCYFHFKNQEVPKELEKSKFNAKQIEALIRKQMQVRKLRESYPDDLDAFCENDLGSEKWDSLSAALNKEPNVYVRVNTHKMDRKQLALRLQDEGFSVDELKADSQALKINSKKSVFLSDSFKKGFFEVQDIASQRVSDFMQIQAGERVIDACAGTGGKSMHLSCLLKNKGKIIALDISQNKLDALKKRAARGDAQNIETRLIENEKSIKRLYATADKLLLDVPCSGTGVFKRNPDAKWKMNPQDIENLLVQQKDILEKYSPMCKVGGKMVYANCSVLHCEGEKQVESFLQMHKNWELEAEARIHPDTINADGFYMARMTKISNE